MEYRPIYLWGALFITLATIVGVILFPPPAHAATLSPPNACLAKVNPQLAAELAKHPEKGYTVAEADQRLVAPGGPCSGAPSVVPTLSGGLRPSFAGWHHTFLGSVCAGPKCILFNEAFGTSWLATPGRQVVSQGPPVCATTGTLPTYSIQITNCAWATTRAGPSSNPFIFARQQWTLTFGWGPFSAHWYYWYWQDDYWNGHTTFGCREC